MPRIPKFQRASKLGTSSAVHASSTLPRPIVFIQSRHSSTPGRRQQSACFVHGVRSNIWGSAAPLISRRAYSTSIDGTKKSEAETAAAEDRLRAEGVDQSVTFAEEGALLDEFEEAEGEDIQTNLAIPPPLSSAPVPEDVSDPDYVQAESGVGLEEVGGLASYWEEKSHWDPSIELEIFGPSKKTRHPAILEVVVRRAVVEALAMQASANEEESSPGLAGTWSVGGPQGFSRAFSVKVAVADEKATLEGDVKRLVDGLRSPGVSDDSILIGSGEAQALLSSCGDNWKRVPLTDHALKFAV